MSKRSHSLASEDAESINNPDSDYEVDNDSNSPDTESEREPVSAAKIPKRKRKKYFQKCKIPILKSFLWATESKKGVSFVHCKACQSDLSVAAGKVELEKHSKTKRRLEKIKIIKNQSTSLDFPSAMKETSLLNSVASAEIRQAAFISEHNLAIKVSDHMPQLYRSMFPDSEIAKRIACARTKTTSVIQTVTGRFNEEKIAKILKNRKFALIIDETTDRSVTKQLALVARVRIKDKIKDLFYDMIPVIKADAVSLHKAISDAFLKRGIPYTENMTGFAADAASVMMGRNHSVSVLLKNEIKGRYHLSGLQIPTLPTSISRFIAFFFFEPENFFCT